MLLFLQTFILMVPYTGTIIDIVSVGIQVSELAFDPHGGWRLTLSSLVNGQARLRGQCHWQNINNALALNVPVN